LLYFMRREVLHQQGLFYNTNGNLQHSHNYVCTR
jgi:hypothetical protein